MRDPLTTLMADAFSSRFALADQGKGERFAPRATASVPALFGCR
jgi:hypothetical protein